MPRLSLSTRQKVVFMSTAGDSQRKIAKYFNISGCSVPKCLQRNSKYQTVDEFSQSGAPKNLSRRTERKLVISFCPRYTK